MKVGKENMTANIYTTHYKNKNIQRTKKEHSFNNDYDKQEFNIINIYPEHTFQKIDGFGGAITEAVGVTLNKMPPKIVDNILEECFGSKGLAYSIIRSHIDSCDFSLSNYSAVEDKNDFFLNTFSIKRDEKYIIPCIHAASKAAGKSLPVMLTPWSPPAFMKTNDNKNNGGKLRKNYYNQWAKYIYKYIIKYLKYDINVKMISIQNEPNAIQKWDSCIFTAQEEKTFLQHHLFPLFQKEGLEDIGIYIWDHNKERLYERAVAIIDEDTDIMIEGIAFHWYSGDHFDAVELAQERFPGKKLISSESCIEYSRFNGVNQLKNAQLYAHDIIGNLNAGMNSFIDWNIVLDQNGGPNHASNFCEAPIICDTEKGTFNKRLSFYYIEHFSRFIRPGSIRIATTKFTSALEITAFKNIDNTLVIVILNKGENTIKSYIRLYGKILPLCICGNTINTIII